MQWSQNLRFHDLKRDPRTSSKFIILKIQYTIYFILSPLLQYRLLIKSGYDPSDTKVPVAYIEEVLHVIDLSLIE